MWLWITVTYSVVFCFMNIYKPRAKKNRWRKEKLRLDWKIEDLGSTTGSLIKYMTY